MEDCHHESCDGCQSHLGVERLKDKALELGAVLSDSNGETTRGLEMNIVRQRILRRMSV